MLPLTTPYEVSNKAPAQINTDETKITTAKFAFLAIKYSECGFDLAPSKNEVKPYI